MVGSLELADHQYCILKILLIVLPLFYTCMQYCKVIINQSINHQSDIFQFCVISFASILNNYGMPIGLFIIGEEELASTESTTQGNPLAMAMYALAVNPLIHSLCQSQPDVSQVWYADDATVGGQLALLLYMYW